MLIALDLPTGTAAVVFYADPLYDEAPLTVEVRHTEQGCISVEQ